MKKIYLLAVTCRTSLLLMIMVTAFTGNAQELMRANLYVVDASGATLVDGNLTNYNNIYSNAVDINDAWKMANPGINFGILRSATNLVVERRSIYTDSDTTYFRMWNMPPNNYRIKLMLKNLDHPGMYGVLQDNYLHTETPVSLNDTTYVDFNINSNPGSAAEMRFQLVYSPYVAQTGALDVNITGIQAMRKGEDILVQWNVVNEESIESYTVEHSVNGRNFSALRQLASLNTPVAKTYDYTDQEKQNITHFYRVKASVKGGKIQYSGIARLNPVTAAGDISIYPNPVTNKTMQVQFSNKPVGRYSIVLLAGNGMRFPLSNIQVSEAQSNHSLSIPQSLPPGVYQLQIIGPDNDRTVKPVQVL